MDFAHPVALAFAWGAVSPKPASAVPSVRDIPPALAGRVYGERVSVPDVRGLRPTPGTSVRRATSLTPSEHRPISSTGARPEG